MLAFPSPEVRCKATDDLAQSIIESIATAIAVIEADGTIIAANHLWIERARGALTHDPEAVPGANLRMLNAQRVVRGEPFAESLDCGLREVIERGSKVFLADQRVDHDGGRHWFALRLAPLVDGSGRIVVSISDITDIKAAQLGMEDSDALLRAVLDLLPQRVFWKDSNGRYLGANRKFLQDAQLADVAGKTDRDMPWTGLADVIRQLDEQVLGECAPALDREYALERNGEPTTWLRWSQVPVATPDGRPIGVLGTYTDISERQRHDQTIARMAEEMSRLALVARKTKNAVVISDSNHQIRWINQGFTRIFGFRGAEVVGKTIHEVMRTDDEGQFTLAAAREGVRATNAYRGEVRFIAADGEPRWCDIDIQPIERSGSELAGYIGVYTDITSQVSLRAQAEASEQRLKLALRSTGKGAWSYDYVTRRIDGDARFAEILGIPATELPAPFERVLAVAFESERPRIESARDRAVQGAAIEIPMIRIRRADGVTRLVDASAIADGGSGRRPRRLIGIAADVTERVNALEERQRSAKLESIGQLAAGIAHEINTPIQYVSDSLYFLRDILADLAAGRTDADTAAQIPIAIERALDGVDRVASIVRSINEFAHPDDRAMTAIDLNELVDRMLTMARNEYKYIADCHFERGALPRVFCRAGDIGQVVLNIVVNAAHAIDERVRDDKSGHTRGHISVRSRLEGDSVLIEIGDDGKGIPHAVREHIFDPFFTTKAVGLGTGQGLAIARRVVEAHRGSLTFTTELGRGTTFVIRLPIVGTTTTREAEAEAMLGA